MGELFLCLAILGTAETRGLGESQNHSSVPAGEGRAPSWPQLCHQHSCTDTNANSTCDKNPSCQYVPCDKHPVDKYGSPFAACQP
eukprot:10960600-Karenia_brevis.AAC.1